eukprot:372747-Rhodomonas_salina.1
MPQFPAYLPGSRSTAVPSWASAMRCPQASAGERIEKRAGASTAHENEVHTSSKLPTKRGPDATQNQQARTSGFHNQRGQEEPNGTGVGRRNVQHGTVTADHAPHVRRPVQKAPLGRRQNGAAGAGGAEVPCTCARSLILAAGSRVHVERALGAGGGLGGRLVASLRARRAL